MEQAVMLFAICQEQHKATPAFGKVVGEESYSGDG